MESCHSSCVEMITIPNGVSPCGNDVRLLFPLYSGTNGCITSAMQYLFQSSILSSERAPLAAQLYTFSQEEISHAHILGQCIARLGGVPRFILPEQRRFWHAGVAHYQFEPGIFLITDLKMRLSTIDAQLYAADRLKNKMLSPILERMAVKEEAQVCRLQQLIRAECEKSRRQNNSVCG